MTASEPLTPEELAAMFGVDDLDEIEENLYEGYLRFRQQIVDRIAAERRDDVETAHAQTCEISPPHSASECPDGDQS